MLFSVGLKFKNRVSSPFYSENVSLQVHRPFMATLPAGRVHLCTSSLPASMTVEAALVLPLTLFFFLALLQPVIWLERRGQVPTALVRSGEEIRQYGIMLR